MRKGGPNVRWMRVVERSGDRRIEGKTSKKKAEEKEEGEEVVEVGVENRRERKEGVRVRVRLGVGGAIRNYCGTIDKRRLRGRTTEDSLRLSDFPSTVASLFRLLLSFLSPALSDFRSGIMPFYPYTRAFAHETFQTRQYVMFEYARTPVRYTTLSTVRSTWNRRFCPTLYISVDASSKPRRDRSTL